MNQISEFESECQNQNTNKIKGSKYLKYNSPIKTVVRIYLRYLSLNHTLHNLSVKLDDAIHGNYIITFGVAVMENFNLLIMELPQIERQKSWFLSE